MHLGGGREAPSPACVAVDQRLQQAVRGQPVGPVQAAGRDFARRPQVRHRGAAFQVDRHPAHHVMGAGPDRNPVAGDVQIELGAHGGDAGKAAHHPLRVEMRQVEVHVRVPRLLHLADDGQADHVAGRQFGAGIVIGHEAVAVAVDQPGPFAARGLADQAAAAAGDVQHRGMELHELHVAQLGPGAIGHGHAVAGGHLGIGRFAIELARPAGGQDRLLGPDHGLAVPAVPHQRAAADAVQRQQIEREGVLPDLDVARLFHAADHHAHDFLAGGVAQGVDDAVVAVSALAAQGQPAADAGRTACPSRSTRGSARGPRPPPARPPPDRRASRRPRACRPRGPRCGRPGRSRRPRPLGRSCCSTPRSPAWR